jgi:replicative DNA helicase
LAEERLPPRDLDAEEAVVGSLLIDGSAIFRIAPTLEAIDFYHDQCRLLYAACISLYQRNEAIDQITVAQELDRQGKLTACGGAAYLSHLISMVPTSLDIEHYGQIVARLSISRRLIQAAAQIEAIGFEADPDVDSSLNRAEDVLFRLRHGQSNRDFVPIRNVLEKYLEPAPETEDEKTKPQIRRVTTGFSGLDELLGGLGRSDLIIVAGRPSMGKTSLALNIATNAAIKQGARSAIFSLEMSRESVVSRILACEADVDSRRIQFNRHGTEDDSRRTEIEERRFFEEEQRIMKGIEVLSEAPIYIDDSPMIRVVEMRSKARRLFFEEGIDLIVVDYLQLIQGDTRNDNRVSEIGYISRSLKSLARELNVPVICVSQLSRAVEWRSTHRPQLSDLRESGSIEQDADVVAFIYRDEYYYTPEEWEAEHAGTDQAPYPAGVADIIVAKHRNGPTGERKVSFFAKTSKFAEMSVQQPSLA